jgi:DNA ligase (NAD+)
MTEMDETKRLEQLRKTIALHRKKYHEQDAPEISDEAYDALLTELQALEEKVEGRVSTASTIGGETSVAFSKVTHKVQQWSFDNVFTETELQDWDARIKRLVTEADCDASDIEYVAEHKIDGLKLVIEYEAGKLVRCPKTARNCIFAHARIDAVTFAEAMRGILAMSDKGVRMAIKTKAEEKKNLFKK